MQDCVVAGKPLVTLPFGSLICHSAMQEFRVRPPGNNRSPPGSGTTLQLASHPLPGSPFSGPASHSSEHSTRPLPHASVRHAALHPSHGVLFPSSHCSPGSTVPSPHAAVGGGHGGNVGFTTVVGGGVIVPPMVGGCAGSRYSIRFRPVRPARTLPRMMAFPLALMRLPPPE